MVDNKRSLHILLWAAFGAGKHYWGPGTSAFRLYSTNKDPSIKVTLIHASDEQDLFPDIFHEQIKLPSLRDTGLIGKLKYWNDARKWIKNNYHRYDVVHGLTAYEYTFRPLLEFEKLGVPTYIKLTGENGGFGNNSKISRMLGIRRRRLLNANKISGYISISSKITDNLLRHGIENKKIYEISNGVNIERFHPVGSKQKIEIRKQLNIKNRFTFIYLGGLTYNKRVIELVKAINELKNSEFIDLQLLIVGPDRSDGKVEFEIDQIIRSKNLEEYIFRIPKTNTPEKYLQASDVFVLISKSEGMSNSLLEAMSCGLPSIVTDISGSQDLIRDGYNGLYTNGTIEDNVDKISSIIGHPLQKMGSNSREIIEKNYSNKIVLDAHIKLFRNKINL